MSLDARYNLLKDVARKAGTLALEFWRNRERLLIEAKAPGDFVSQADREVEGLIRDEIARAFPGDGFLGEESAEHYVPGDGGVWVVDPIDGTHNFLRGIPYWNVSIAYVEHGRRTLGAVYDPPHDELFHARRGHGAWRRTASGEVRLTAGRPAGLEGGIIALGHHDRYPDPRYTAIRRELLRTHSAFRNFGAAALSLAHVADGRLDAFIEVSLSAWDVMAALLLIEEAGGCVGPYPGVHGLTGRGPVIATAAARDGVIARITECCEALLEQASPHAGDPAA